MTRADIAFEDVVDRCASCGKRLAVDVGQDVFGNSTGSFVCFNCGPIPQVSDWDAALIRAAVIQVTHRLRSAA